MPVAKLRKIGGSVMIAIPPAVLDQAGVGVDMSIDISVDAASGTIALQRAKPRYRLADLLADIDPEATDTEEDRAWINGRAVGSEMI